MLLDDLSFFFCSGFNDLGPRADETFRPLEYPTVLFEFTTAAVWRIEDGFDGAGVFLRELSADVIPGLDAVRG